MIDFFLVANNLASDRINLDFPFISIGIPDVKFIKQYPPTLEALLLDNRFPVPRRYLRQIDVDPISGMSNWGILEAPSGGIMGVYSLGSGTPSKVANFSQADKAFEGKQFYEEWVFAYLPSVVVNAQGGPR